LNGIGSNWSRGSKKSKKEMFMEKILSPKKNQEWSSKSVNCCTGCSNNCRYCYGRQMAVRFRQVKEEEWPAMHIRQHDVQRKHKNYGEVVMFPSSHDITKGNLDACRTVLAKLLAAGNEVLVVSKPDLTCIIALCEACKDFRDNILFRFTIGAMDNGLLSFWVPGAPSYEERRDALKYAFENGFQTSVSAEPMIDAYNMTGLVAELLPYITETLWIGKMNYLGRVKVDSAKTADAVERVKASQSDDRILAIFNSLSGLGQIRWKDSIRRVVKRSQQ
jgi:DNA repair photolyase